MAWRVDGGGPRSAHIAAEFATGRRASRDLRGLQQPGGEERPAKKRCPGRIWRPNLGPSCAAAKAGASAEGGRQGETGLLPSRQTLACFANTWQDPNGIGGMGRERARAAGESQRITPTTAGPAH